MKVAERTDPKFSKDVCYSEADNLANYRDKYRFRFVFTCSHTSRKKGDCLRNPVTNIKYTVNNITGSKDKGQSSNKEKKKTQLVKLMSAAFLPSK